jgi:hypothetical protein
MKTALGIGILLLSSMAFSCINTGSPPATGGEKNVNFMTTSGHFVKNNYVGETNPSYLVIKDYPAFDALFGVGMVMGMSTSQLITADKMKNGFVVSIIYQGNDIHKFTVEKVALKDGQLQVYYTSKVTEPNATWTCNCNVTILVDNCAFDAVKFFENGRPVPDAVVMQL